MSGGFRVVMPGIIWSCNRPGRQGIGEQIMIPFGTMVAVANAGEDDLGIRIKRKKKENIEGQETISGS